METDHYFKTRNGMQFTCDLGQTLQPEDKEHLETLLDIMADEMTDFLNIGKEREI